MQTITLPDGYNGHTIECYAKPVWSDGVIAKLAVVGSAYLIKYALVKDLPPNTACTGLAPTAAQENIGSTGASQ